MLESALKEQLKGIFANLEGNFTFDIYVSPQHEHRNELVELLTDVADCSSHISCRVNEGKRLEFTLLKNDHKTDMKLWLLKKRWATRPTMLKSILPNP